MVFFTQRLVPMPFHVILITSPIKSLKLLPDLEAVRPASGAGNTPGNQRQGGGAAVAPGSSLCQVLPCLVSGLLSELCQAATVPAVDLLNCCHRGCYHGLLNLHHLLSFWPWCSLCLTAMGAVLVASRLNSGAFIVVWSLWASWNT
ncbi:hypothetical protein MC885_006865 [Smutsia gigantea]|nr:hypothetical protein MC885_006865 [Smutsia gigantea]